MIEYMMMCFMIFIWTIGWGFTFGTVVPRELTAKNVVMMFAIIVVWPIALGEWVGEKLGD